MRATDVEVCGRSYRAVVADSFFHALAGVHAVGPDIEAVVIRGSSVHGLTLRQPMWVFGVDERGDGLDGSVLHPKRIMRFRGAKAVVEFPHGLSCQDEHRSHTIRWSG